MASATPSSKISVRAKSATSLRSKSTSTFSNNNVGDKGEDNDTKGKDSSIPPPLQKNTKDDDSNKKANKSWSIWGSSNTPAEQNSIPPTTKLSSTRTTGSIRSNNSSEEVPDSITTATNANANVSNEVTQKDTASTDTNNIDENHDETSRARGWSFWQRQPKITTYVETESTTKTQPTTEPFNPLVNTLIPPSSEKESLLSRIKSNMPGFQSPNIMVPDINILPKQSLWTSLSHMFTFNEEKQKFLYRADPYSKLSEMSNGGKRPIKVLIVGIHGFFPTKMIRPFIGEPTGTSTKFIKEAEEIVEKYFHDHDQACEISKIALEKEGDIFDRVEYFFSIMQKWAKEINDSDFIYFVSHSQGCPVSIILLAKLIESGIINVDNSKFFTGSASAEVGFCSQKKIISVLAMAGINNGPFYGADQTLFVRAYQTIERDSLRELFEFQKFDSIQSKKFINGLRVIIANNVKVTFVGSINDQLVPLYSSTCLFADHPNIFRTTFIDKSSMTPSFIMRIIKIAGTLLNLGYDDHGIVKEISGSLAGPLTGGGHSTVYNEKQVYELGVKFALETTDTTTTTSVTYTPYKLSELGTNPYHLPWSMRGLIYETKKYLGDEEINQLYKEFEEWKPETKQLKDIKYRLNGLRYKL
ncbi:uncharacterized protein NDAI_0C00920 [Naumovozyma dairenensis CBS 421]|uniref:YMC020W-like alpha/beta hydrolase domain-containing protein n=1 Tax=Naumovozyma dairenensis (strain ATCC 10597 / BCRC 20456 / CBS 421 / NBRC 0211 / NRRL Y-12639) TaxID=1071378 RepID=G0W7J2_NAUDC|nr:hypothetical protein NDAI_0C00920 [Naumovozyma dairenensis CBS 421]CCD23753.1 hypothetical protein NDAI_0C00920 [Naumovozyma dairenensis CBS 421]